MSQAEMKATPSQALYRFFDADGHLLYVGISLNPGERWKQHRADKPWWLEVASITIDHLPDRDAALQAETAAIKSERPRYNIAQNGSVEGAERAAQMLTRMGKVPDRYYAPCPTCGTAQLPCLLYPNSPESDWLAAYECCGDAVWTREIL